MLLSHEAWNHRLNAPHQPQSMRINYWIFIILAFGVENGTHVSLTSDTSFVSGNGSYQLLRVRNAGEPNFDLIGYFRGARYSLPHFLGPWPTTYQVITDGLLVEIAMKYANYTFVVRTDGDSTICLLNTVPCQSFGDEIHMRLILAANPDEQATIAIRSGMNGDSRLPDLSLVEWKFHERYIRHSLEHY